MLKLEQALHAAKVKKLHINICQVIQAAGNGLDMTHYQPLLDSYAVNKNKTFESLDKMVVILKKFDKHSHIKAPCKAHTTKATDNKSKMSPPATSPMNVTPSGTTPTLTLTPQDSTTTSMLDDVHKINKKKKKCLVSGGGHFTNQCKHLKTLGWI